MDAVEIKRNAFRARWLTAATGAFDAAPRQGAAGPLVFAPDAFRDKALVPRLMFREQAFAAIAPARRSAVLSRPRLARAAMRLAFSLVALAATGIGLQKVFKDAPGYLATLSSSINADGSSSAHS